MSTAIARNIPWKLPEPLPTRQPLPPSQPEYKIPDASEIEHLSTQQKLALLQMSRRVSHQAIWRAMREKFEAPPFTRSTFAQLREIGLAEMLDGQKYHSLTDNGARLCDLIGRQLVSEHKIHSPWIGGNDGAHVSLHCTFGWSCAMVRGTGMQLKAARAMSTHLRTIEAMNGLKMALAPRKNC